MLAAVYALAAVMVLAAVGASEATIIVAAIAGATTILGAMLSRQNEQSKKAVKAAESVAQSIGDPNGHGNLSQALGKVITAQKVMLARIDAQDIASADERRLRDDGQQRQLRILDEIAAVKAAQESYVRAGDLGSVELIQRLETAVDRISTLLGEPEDGWDSTPVIPYVHAAVHDLRNEIGKLRVANSLLAQQVTPDEGDTP